MVGTIMYPTENASPVSDRSRDPKPALYRGDVTAARLTGYVADMGRQYPTAWRTLDLLRARYGRHGWPRWCFLPMSYASLIPDRTETGDFDMNRIAQVAALGAWRVTQGIYRFDETVLDALWKTPVHGEIPSAVLCALPEWCVYIETPGRHFDRAPINGFLAFFSLRTMTNKLT